MGKDCKCVTCKCKEKKKPDYEAIAHEVWAASQPLPQMAIEDHIKVIVKILKTEFPE
jgi:hypothetical protein